MQQHGFHTIEYNRLTLECEDGKYGKMSYQVTTLRFQPGNSRTDQRFTFSLRSTLFKNSSVHDNAVVIEDQEGTCQLK